MGRLTSANARRVAAGVVAVLAAAGVLAGVSGGGPGPSGEPTNYREYATRTENIAPSAVRRGSAQQASPDEQAAVVGARAELAQHANGAPSGEAFETSSTAAPVTAAAAPEFHGTPSQFVIASHENVLADDVGRASQLSSPVAVSQGPLVFMAGRFYASYSTDKGASWNAISIPAGPADAPKFLGNVDAVYDQARGVTLYALLYGRNFDADPGPDNGVVVIFVRRKINLADNCSYTIDPDGASNNVLPDLPHLGLSNNFLYLGTSELTNGGGQTARVRRFALDSIVDCVSAATTTFSLPQTTMGPRVLRPVDGARSVMYFGALIGASSATSLRLFRWPETSSTVTSSDFALGETSVFGDADCRGGANNKDWWDASAASSMGQSLVGAVGRNRISFYWNVAATAAHAQGHVHGVAIDEVALTKIGDPVLWNGGFCIGFPAVAANERGDLGFSLPTGGKAGGGGTALAAWAGVLDDYTLGSNPNFMVAAMGTHNPNLATFGEVSARSSEPCDYFWTATNYVFNGGATAPYVDANYVKFGRGRDSRCLTN